MAVKTEDLPSIASGAMLGALNISVWEARKKDKTTEQEVADMKGAKSKRATSVHKHLFSECPSLEAIKTLRGEARQWFNRVTLEWATPHRLITTKQYFEIMQDAARYEARFNTLVAIFVGVYNTEISKQAFQMGSLFNRDEYPDVSEIKKKFRFSIDLSPMPLAGDFRLDIGKEALKELQERAERDTLDRIQVAVSDAWNRVKEKVEHIRDRMDAVMSHDPDATEETKTVDDDGNELIVVKKKRRPKLHDSMLDTGLELCGLMSDLNVTNDPQLEEARKMLEKALVHVDMDSLKESPEMQQSTRQAMQDILDKFSF